MLASAHDFENLFCAADEPTFPLSACWLLTTSPTCARCNEPTLLREGYDMRNRRHGRRRRCI
jgi:hypothetical protein